jgi:hypothetical protein
MTPFLLIVGRAPFEEKELAHALIPLLKVYKLV